MRLGVLANAAGATATSAALLLAGRYATGWRPIVAILVVSAVLAAALNVTLRLRAQHERTRMRGVALRALRASEQEREEVARALGDEATQLLAGALLNLRAARASRSDRTSASALEPGADQLGNARSAIIATMEHLERGSSAMRSSLMDLLGPEAALLSLARTACEHADLRLRADAGVLGPIPAGARMALFRITQDAIENVVQHAHATELILETGHDGREAIVALEDDGDGFDARRALREPGSALGLSTMSELAAYWGGSVRIRSRVGAGTRVEVRFPLKSMPADA